MPTFKPKSVEEIEFNPYYIQQPLLEHLNIPGYLRNKTYIDLAEDENLRKTDQWKYVLRSTFGKNKLIYCDPPWWFSNWDDNMRLKEGSEIARRRGRPDYPVMSKEELNNLHIDKFAHEDCILLCWATWPKLLDALEFIKCNGFEYKTVGFVWFKLNKCAEQYEFQKGMGIRDIMSVSLKYGLGYHTRKNTEILLIGTKGKPKRYSSNISEIVFEEYPEEIFEPLGEHSSKPRIIYDKIKEYAGDIPRIELFARPPVPRGWIATGLDYDGWGIEDILNG